MEAVCVEPVEVHERLHWGREQSMQRRMLLPLLLLTGQRHRLSFLDVHQGERSLAARSS